MNPEPEEIKPAEWARSVLEPPSDHSLLMISLLLAVTGGFLLSLWSSCAP